MRRIFRFGFWCLLLAFVAVTSISAKGKKVAATQTKVMPRTFTFDDAMRFEKIKELRVSNNANWTGFRSEQDRGNVSLHIRNNKDSSIRLDIANGTGIKFSNNEMFAAFKLNKTEIQQENKDENAKESIVLLNLLEMRQDTIEGGLNYSFSEDSQWFLYKLKGDGKKSDSLKEKKVGQEVRLKHLESGTEIPIIYVSDYIVDTLSHYFFYSISSPDGKRDGLYYRDLNAPFAPEIKIMLGNHEGFNNLAWNHKKNILAFTHHKLDKKGKPEDCELINYNIDEKRLDTIVKLANYPKDWYIPSANELVWNETGNLLYFGFKPSSEKITDKDKFKWTDSNFYNEDTLLSRAEVYVWGWNDPDIITIQQNQWNKAKDKVYDAIYNINTKKIIQLEDIEITDIVKSKNDNYAIMYTEKPYKQSRTWGSDYADFYIVNLNTGEKKKLYEKSEELGTMSKSGNYIAYYKDKNWYLYDVVGDKHTNITQNISTEFYDIYQDVPSELRGVGFGGWLDDDKGFFLYDNWDIWYFETANPSVYRNLTQKGKAERTTYRLVQYDRDADYFNTTGTLIVTAFNKANKNSGIYRLLLSPDRLEEKITQNAQTFGGIFKAKGNNTLIYSKGSYNEYPNYYATDLQFNTPKRITDLNLNLTDTFNWGHTELVEFPYRTSDGRDTLLQGYIVLPDNYDKNKKYPVFVYFYDQWSDRMNYFDMPGMGHRPMNQVYMDNYIMFFPDICYGGVKTTDNVPYSKIGSGNPGKDALNTILAGCRYLAAKGIIDTNKACIQGHSWGGYQTSYIATQPTFFAAACGGACVGNMTSAYSGVRTESGRFRQMQYEVGQSRIGGSIFDSLDAYIRNSPIFFANKSTTPLLLSHGNIDQMVPFQQGVEIYSAFRRAGKPCWLLEYVNEQHWQDKYWNRTDYSIKMKQFFDYYCLGKPEPEWMKGQPYKGENWGK